MSEVTPAPESKLRGWRFFPTTMLVVVVVALLLLFRLNPAEHSFFPKCVFHSISGLDCPGCGAQRAVHHLLHGHLATAFRCNAFFICMLPVAAWYLARFVMRRISGFSLPSPFRHHAWPWVLAVVVVLFGIVRNLPGFEWLRP